MPCALVEMWWFHDKTFCYVCTSNSTSYDKEFPCCCCWCFLLATFFTLFFLWKLKQNKSNPGTAEQSYKMRCEVSCNKRETSKLTWKTCLLKLYTLFHLSLLKKWCIHKLYILWKKNSSIMIMLCSESSAERKKSESE